VRVDLAVHYADGELTVTSTAASLRKRVPATLRRPGFHFPAEDPFATASLDPRLVSVTLKYHCFAWVIHEEPRRGHWRWWLGLDRYDVSLDLSSQAVTPSPQQCASVAAALRRERFSRVEVTCVR